MELFSRFFRKPLPSARPPQAPRAPDERVAPAIEQLPVGDELRRLAGLTGAVDSASAAVPAAVERAARARMAELIDEGAVDFAGFCAQAGNRPAMFAVAALCKDPKRLAEALASIDDPLQVALLVVDSPSSRLRQLAAQAVEDPAQLRRLLKQVRARDKGVYKILKQKCDALNAEDRKAAQIASEAGAVCASLERHSQRRYDALYTPAFEQLELRWRSLAAAPTATIEQRAAQAIDRCREVIAAHLRQAEQQAAERAAQQTAKRAAQELQERSLQAAQEAARAQAEADAQLRKEAAAVREAEEQFFRRIGGLIRKANDALRDGNTQKAAALRRAIEQRLPTGPAMPAHLTRHVQQLDDKLSELRQWKDYAVAPKRSQLIEEMESLVGSTEGPRILAERIQSLQQEWRTISKGIVSDAPEDWERFHQASQAAYQPVREHFEAQAKLRQANLEKRRALLERLGAFEAQTAATPDWRLLARVLREAPQEWRRYLPVDRDANRPVQEEFDASMDRLQARIGAWYERNVADKQSLVKRARHLLTQEDSREAIDAVKRLQLLWKETGQAPRDQEQSLWSEFRETCDAVYQKRQQAYAEYAAGLEAAKVKAVALCEEAERTAALSGMALLEAAAKVPEWRAAFEALDEMPRAEARGLHSRFERALDRCEARVAEQHARDAEQSVMNLLEAGRRTRAYGWAVARNADASEREALKQAAETFIASIQDWPKGGLQAVKETLAKSGSLSEADAKSREKALRMLCIRSEIYSETASPPEDEALRREYQVQRLMQGMGQGSHADDGDRDAMILEWIRIGAVQPAVHENLQERFMRQTNRYR